MKTSLLVRNTLQILAAAAFVFATQRSFADDSPLSHGDKSFVEDAYQDGLAEIAMATMAQNKTANADVKAFAEKLAADHTKADGELKTLADAKKVTTATEPSLISQGKAKLMDAKSGSDFDKAYIDSMVDDHKKDIETFKKVANSAQDADVKAFASKTLPVLEKHLSMAEALQQKLGK